MTYQQTLEYLYANLPMFQRIGAAAYNRDLGNTLALCAELGDPQTKFATVHIAGTNGKGSSSHMIAAILQSAGYKTGLYTSPHLKEFTERIKINGAELSKDFVVDFVERIQPALEGIHPSFFETTVAMAFDYFREEKVDIAVIETGLGGRLDSTNVITPLVSLITNISLDHKDLLGDTLPKIASEKAGIIKHAVPAVVSERQSEVMDVFIDKAKAMDAPLKFASDAYTVHENGSPGLFDVLKNGEMKFKNLACELKGSYQRRNLPGVLAAVDQLRTLGYNITDEHVRGGIERVVTLTGLKGRWQMLGDKPLMFCDIGHNEDGIREVLRNIGLMSFKKLHIVFGMVNDKDITGVLALLPHDAQYYFCQANIPRAMKAAELGARAATTGLHGIIIPEVAAAIEQAKKNASDDDMIFIGGSTFVVAEAPGL